MRINPNQTSGPGHLPGGFGLRAPKPIRPKHTTPNVVKNRYTSSSRTWPIIPLPHSLKIWSNSRWFVAKFGPSLCRYFWSGMVRVENPRWFVDTPTTHPMPRMFLRFLVGARKPMVIHGCSNYPFHVLFSHNCCCSMKIHGDSWIFQQPIIENPFSLVRILVRDSW